MLLSISLFREVTIKIIKSKKRRPRPILIRNTSPIENIINWKTQISKNKQSNPIFYVLVMVFVEKPPLIFFQQ